MREDKSKYEQKGVEDEDGLREIVVESEDEKDKATKEKTEKGWKFKDLMLVLAKVAFTKKFCVTVSDALYTSL